LSVLLVGLRRRALIFPPRFTYFGTYRDIFYHWPPMSEDALVPVLEWRRPAARPARGATRMPAFTFLSDMDQVLDAVFAAPLELRPTLTPHLNAARTPWLRKWEHDAAEVDKLLRSRAGWAPDPRAVRVFSTSGRGAGGARLNGQTGLRLPSAPSGYPAAGLNLITAPGGTMPPVSAIRPQHMRPGCHSRMRTSSLRPGRAGQPAWRSESKRHRRGSRRIARSARRTWIRPISVRSGAACGVT
jgi:hypothetical protein